MMSSWGDKTVRLIDSDDAKFKRNYGGATDFLYFAGCHADGRNVVAGGQDSKLFEWNVEDGKSSRSSSPLPRRPARWRANSSRAAVRRRPLPPGGRRSNSCRLIAPPFCRPQPFHPTLGFIFPCVRP